MEFIDDGRFADAGVAGNKNQLWPAAGYDPVESGDQSGDFRFPPVQFLGY